MKKLSPSQAAQSMFSALCGIAVGLVSLGLAIGLLLCAYAWLALGAACYGVAMIGLGWSAGHAVERAGVEEEEP